ncbi:hypothetical protein ACFL1R_09755 [Candidatus Latescibacterota bacterium]
MKKITVFCALIIVFSLLNAEKTCSEEQKDSFKAFLLSLAVPGLGQYYAGSPGYAKFFIAAELAIWGGYYYNSKMMDTSRQDYFSQAALHAGVNPSGIETSYLNAIGAYNSSFEYNQRKLQSDPNPVLYSGELSWNWDREQSRLRFRNLRERELDYENNIKYCIAGIVLNHFIAALNASHQAKKQDAVYSMITINIINCGICTAYSRSF